MSQAILWRQIKNQKVQCMACSHFCLIAPHEKGKCGVRINVAGGLISLVRDKVAAMNLDPIEKKPLYHYLPGSHTLSMGTMGCNLSCTFCQNHSLSQPPKNNEPVQGNAVSSEQIIALSREYNAKSISYTYSEPTIFIELVRDIAIPSKAAGLKNLIVSNGFQSKQCLQEMSEYIDAANIDLKAYTERFYRDYCDASLKPVLDNLVRIKEMGWWLEVTTLLIPGLNNSEQEIKDMAGFIHDNLGSDTPWHISGFHPTYKMTDRQPTKVEDLEKAFETGKSKGLKFVYTGNSPGHRGGNTICSCGETIVKRSGFRIQEIKITDKACPSCGQIIPGVWD